MPPIEHAALPMSLLDRFKGKEEQSQLVLCLRFLVPLSRPSAITFGDGR
jgi:succinylglutamate desuccinylase